MKALMSKNAKKMMSDKAAREQLRDIVSSGSQRATIKLSDGQTFLVKTKRG